MAINRREAIKLSTGAVGALLTPTTFTELMAQSPPSAAGIRRLKLEAFTLDPQLVQALKRGVEVMKSRKPSSPTSWFFQAAIHGVSEEAIAEATQGDPDVANVDKDKFWNRCPHFPALQAPSADFLIWHRAYLYYFERILRDAAGEPQLALPYWNYLEAGQGTFPAVFANPDPATPGGPPRNPLFDGRRENAFTSGVLELNPAAVNANRAFNEKRFFGEFAAEGFAGAVDNSEPVSQGLVERNPHNLLHFAIGGFIGSDPAGENGTGGLMASVPTAAFDPIFWVHHCNIDRIWSVWETMPGREWGFSPDQAWFNERPWSFYDADGTVKNEPRSHYIRQKNLGFVFDSDVEAAPRLSDSLPGAVTPRLFNAALLRVAAPGAVAAEHTVAIAGGPVTLTPEESKQASIGLADARPFGAASFRAALTAPAKREIRRSLLVMEGLAYSGVPSVSYEVYVNQPDGEQPNSSSKNFVGVLGLFGTQHTQIRNRTHAVHESDHANQDHANQDHANQDHANQDHANQDHDRHGEVFDVSQIVMSADSPAAELRLTFVPVPLLRMKNNNAIVRPAAKIAKPDEKVVIDSMRLIAVEAGLGS